MNIKKNYEFTKSVTKQINHFFGDLKSGCKWFFN